MKMSKNVEKWYDDRKREGIAKTEAYKKVVSRAAKNTALYGFMTLTAVSGIGLAGVYTTVRIQDFFRNNEVAFALPVEMKVWRNRVVSVKPVEHEILVLENTKAADEAIAKSDNPTLAQKICSKDWNCEVALAVAKAEGLNHPADGWSLNDNGSIDVGYFRINSVHFNQNGCSLTEVSTEDGNINCAYDLWKAQGWEIWSAYNNGSYLARL